MFHAGYCTAAGPAPFPDTKARPNGNEPHSCSTQSESSGDRPDSRYGLLMLIDEIAARGTAAPKSGAVVGRLRAQAARMGSENQPSPKTSRCSLTWKWSSVSTLKRSVGDSKLLDCETAIRRRRC